LNNAFAGFQPKLLAAKQGSNMDFYLDSQHATFPRNVSLPLANVTASKRALWEITLLLLASGSAVAQNLKVTLLGTGSPPPRMDRFGPCILVEAGTQRLLFDCGRGATQRLERAALNCGIYSRGFPQNRFACTAAMSESAIFAIAHRGLLRQ
jgi:hypothetical protein